MRIGVYPGTFDPITNGHRDIIGRAMHVVDRLIVAIAVNAVKEPTFALSERVALVEAEVNDLPDDVARRIEVRPFDILLMDFVAACGAHMVVRGLRAVSDFDYEFQMAGMNARLAPDIETIFLMASEPGQFISSRFVKEIFRLNGNVEQFVSPRVVAALGKTISRD